MYMHETDFNFVLDSVSLKVSTLCAWSLVHSNHRLRYPNREKTYLTRKLCTRLM